MERRLLETGLSDADLVQLKNLYKARELTFRLKGLQSVFMDLDEALEEDVYLDISVVGDDEKTIIKVPLNNADDDREQLSEESEDLLVDTLFPYCETEGRTRIESLSIECCSARIVGAILHCFRRSNLSSFEASDCATNFLDTTNVTELQETFRRLENLSLSSEPNHLSLETQSRLARALENTRCLSKVSLMRTKFNRAGFRALLEKLSGNHQLRRLEFSFHVLEDLGAEDLRRLGQLVAALPELVNVNIRSNNLTDPKCLAFLAELSECRHVCTLCMEGNEMSLPSSSVLARIVSNGNTKLCRLWLPSLSDEAAVVLFDSLQDNTSVKVVLISDISKNTVAKKGAHSLKTLLERNDTITCIGIGSNTFCDECIANICRGLENNTSVAELYLRFQTCVMPAFKSLCRLITRNQTLKELDLYPGSVVEKGMIRELSNAMAQNATLESFSILPTAFESGAADVYVSCFASNFSVTTTENRPRLEPHQNELINLHLAMNRFGRKYMFDSNLAWELCPWILAKANRYDKKHGTRWGLHFLWFAVRNKPEIYHVASRHHE